MYKDPTEFRARFKVYKEGKMPYENGLPKFAGGTPGLVNPYTLPLLQEFEGFKDSVYLDGKGIPTIGWGFTDSSLVNKGKISRKEADAELQRLAGNVESNLISKLGIDNWKQMSPESQAALISYAYNYPAGFKDTTNFMKLWRAGKYWDAIDEVDAGMYDKANPGLKKRRLKEQSYLRKDPFFLATSSAPTKKTDAELKIPIINKNDATTINKVIPQEQMHTTWEGAQDVSPYLTGKPMLRPIHRVQLPNLIDVIEDDLWESEFKLPGMKNGKLPKYVDGKTKDMKQKDEKDLMWYAKPFVWNYITGGLPVDTIRERLYNNLVPVSYKTDKYPWVRARDAIVNNEKESLENFDERQRAGALARDEIYAQYLHIPKNKRRNVGFELEDAKYKPTLNDKGEHYYSINFGESGDEVRRAIINNAMKTSAVLDDGIDADGYSDFYNLPGLLPNQVKASVVLNDLLGWHRVGRAIDPKKGDYVSYWDRWDLTPVGRNGEDLSMGIGTPVNIYDRIYLDDYYGVDSSAPNGTYYGGYLPEVEILPKHNNGKIPGYKDGKSSIHIKPANRGKLTRLKARTGKSESELYNDGNPAHKKMVVFARNARKWKH